MIKAINNYKSWIFLYHKQEHTNRQSVICIRILLLRTYFVYFLLFYILTLVNNLGIQRLCKFSEEGF